MICVTNGTYVDPLLFNHKVYELLHELGYKAVDDPLLYAHGNLQFGLLSGSIYGVAQCTQDLPIVNCRKCFQVAMSELLVQSWGMRVECAYYGNWYIKLYSFIYTMY